MSNGLYSAAAGLAAQQLRMDALASDLANVNTTGYKRARIGFRDLVYTESRSGALVGSGTAVVPGGRSFAQGVLLEDSSTLSVAIEGPGFLQVRGADGRTALTRDGALRADARGALVTSSGARLVPPVALPRGTELDALSIAADGTISANGTRLGRIVVVEVPVAARLEALGDNLFLPTPASGAPAPARGAALRQGYLEASTAGIAEGMTALIEAQRALGFASRAVKYQDQLLEIANGIRR